MGLTMLRQRCLLSLFSLGLFVGIPISKPLLAQEFETQGPEDAPDATAEPAPASSEESASPAADSAPEGATKPLGETSAQKYVEPSAPPYEGLAVRGGEPLFDLKYDRDRPRNYIVPPLVSLFLPGFDQWWENQNSAVYYTGVAVGGLLYGVNASKDVKASTNSDDSEALSAKGIAERKVLLGLQTYQSAGGMSAYHSFRSAIRSRPNEFKFLRYEESPKDILLAPFNFSYLSRPTTWIPLGVGLAIAGASIYALDRDKDDDMERVRFTQADAVFSSALSYNAGTHEEAVFRGWIMPVFMEWTGSEFWSAISSAALFAAAHLSTNSRPVAQFALGWYWGDLSQRNHWTLGEGIFIHAWWDVIFFAASYHFEKVRKSDKTNVSSDVKPAFWLPPLVLAF